MQLSCHMWHQKAAAIKYDKEGVQISPSAVFRMHLAGDMQHRKHGPKLVILDTMAAQCNTTLAQVREIPLT